MAPRLRDADKYTVDDIEAVLEIMRTYSHKTRKRVQQLLSQVDREENGDKRHWRDTPWAIKEGFGFEYNGTYCTDDDYEEEDETRLFFTKLAVEMKRIGPKLKALDTFEKENWLGCCNKTAPTYPPYKGYVEDTYYTGKEEKVMNISVENDTRKYLLNRLCSVEYSKKIDAEKHYLPTAKRPKTVKELKEFIAAGKIAVLDDFKDDYVFEWMNPNEVITFIDPEKPRNPEGYNAALKQINTDSTETKDAIMVFKQEQGLAALNKFEEKTYH